MNTWSGLIFSSGTITADGDSGWLDLADILGYAGAAGLGKAPAFKRAVVRCVPAGHAGDETNALDLNVAWDVDGDGDLKIHDFTGIDANNTAETVIIPGEDSVAAMFTATSYLPGLIPNWWKFTWDLGGTTPSVSFAVYASLEW